MNFDIICIETNIKNMQKFDVIVIGGGHAGCEAALAAARMGASTLLVTSKASAIATMPCNPAIGGLAKSHLVYELDALGGEMGRNADATALQAKILNSSRGPAVQATRTQCAKREYSDRMKSVVASQPNLRVLEDTAAKIVTTNNIGLLGEYARVCIGIECVNHGFIEGTSVVITSGTALRGVIWTGKESQTSAGDGRPAANDLSDSLKSLAFTITRLKTGTPPRLYAESCDFSVCQRLDGDHPRPLFHVEHFISDTRQSQNCSTWNNLPELPCWMTHTNATTHQIIMSNLEKSALYGGSISGTGVRYCPSIEDKIVRFANASTHHVILEPEDSEQKIIYPNGLSCSLPENIQEKMVRSVAGLENAQFKAYAYAIEYDSIDSRDLYRSLESKNISNLYFAGQINGTTGYEEAAAQGIMAGINAARKSNGECPIVLSRNEAYIGVMIDDLVTKGTDEPYRMFTSRAERRLLLRQDNARLRLVDIAAQVGILSGDQIAATKALNNYLSAIVSNNPSKEWKYELSEVSEANTKLNAAVSDSAKSFIIPNDDKHNSGCSNSIESHKLEREDIRTGEERQSVQGFKTDNTNIIITIPENAGRSNEQKLANHFLDCFSNSSIHPEVWFPKSYIENEIRIMRHYMPYIIQENNEVEKLKNEESTLIPKWLDYDKCTAIRYESREKLKKHRPETLFQAGRIPGVNPSDVSILSIIIKRGHV